MVYTQTLLSAHIFCKAPTAKLTLFCDSEKAAVYMAKLYKVLFPVVLKKQNCRSGVSLS